MLIEIRTLPRSNPSGRGSVPRICVLRCDVCETQYERPYSRVQLEAKIHRCSLKCVYGSRSTDGLGGRGAAVVEVTCLVCAKPMRLRKTGNERKWGHTCSRKCYGTYRAQHPELYVENTEKMWTAEAALKISEACHERMARPEYVHPWQGQHHTEETKQRLRVRRAANPMVGEKNGMFGRKHKESSKEAMSDKHTTLLLSGQKRPYGGNSKKGVFTSTKTGRSHHFKSGWEHAMMEHLDTCDVVLTWNYESVRIPYYYNGNKRWYVPDFIVTFWGGEAEMWEVKPKEFIGSEKNLLKEAAAREWCKENDVSSYHVLTGDELRTRGIL